MSILGTTQRDQITGFQGVVTAFAEYISGCNQALLLPKVDEKGGHREGQWFDIQRLASVDADRVVLKNGVTPGCDKAAPKR